MQSVPAGYEGGAFIYEMFADGWPATMFQKGRDPLAFLFFLKTRFWVLFHTPIANKKCRIAPQVYMLLDKGWKVVCLKTHLKCSLENVCCFF